MPTPIPSDESLMLRYRDGDLSAFRELYTRHSRGLYRFLAWRSPRREWVDEIAQDSWISLHKARQRYEPQASFRVYLYQIARNRLIDLLRQQQPVLASELVQPEEDADWLEQVRTDTPTPDAELESKRSAAELHAAIRALPVEQKEALILQQFNGLSLEEIAALSDAPVETVKSRLRYAMKKLRERLVQTEAAQERQA